METKEVFSSGYWEYTACLNFSRHQEIGYIEGYRKAANILVDYIRDKRIDNDYLIYPIFYLYRHHLELRIKDLLEKGCKLFDLPFEREKHANHNIKKLWDNCKLILEKVNPGKENFYKIDALIDDISQIDDNSMRFRYPTDKRGNNSLDPRIKVINIEVLVNNLNETFNLLEGAREEVVKLLDIKDCIRY